MLIKIGRRKQTKTMHMPYCIVRDQWLGTRFIEIALFPQNCEFSPQMKKMEDKTASHTVLLGGIERWVNKLKHHSFFPSKFLDIHKNR